MESFLEEEEMRARLYAQPQRRATLGYCEDGGLLRLDEAAAAVPVCPEGATAPIVVEGVPCYRCERCGAVHYDLALLAAIERSIKARLEQGGVPPQTLDFEALGIFPKGPASEKLA